MVIRKLAFVVLVLGYIETITAQGDAAGKMLNVAKACYSGFVANIPPSFCYKKGADFGTIPTTCSSGYFRYLALCYRNCDSGYKFVLGVCWQTCGKGYSDHGLTCYKNLFSWHFKKSYIPSSYTNFDSRVTCESGKYKAGALCYRDCKKIGLLNCGIGACAATTESCATSIATMAVDFLISLGQAVTFVASFGSSGGAGAGFESAKASVKKGFEKLGSGAVNAAAKSFKAVIARVGRSAFLKQVAEHAFKNLAKFAAEGIAMGVVTTVCQNIGNKMLDKMEQSKTIKIDWQSFDPTGISSAVSSCKDMKNSNDNIACAQAVLNVVSVVDPTGVAGMAAAVMAPVCNGV